MNLFEKEDNKQSGRIVPLADRIRPRSFDEFIGQEEIIGADKPLRKVIHTDNIPSIIFWGPPGSGKTTLASIIANQTKFDFISFSAVTSGVKEIKAVVEKARYNRQMHQQGTIVFVGLILCTASGGGFLFRFWSALTMSMHASSQTMHSISIIGWGIFNYEQEIYQGLI